jgi:ubiquinone/menaquinone biosynthesis C-methylase UbiE
VSIKNLQENWQKMAVQDPLWAVLAWDEKKNNKWNELDFFNTGAGEIKSVMEYIQSLGINLDKKSALDFGCGVGRLTQPLSKYFEQVTGVDIAPAMIEKAKKLNSSANCNFILNTAPNLEIFSDNIFSFVYSRLTLQHIKPVYAKKYIKEFIRILKPGGLVIFVQPYKIPFRLNYLGKVSTKEILRIILPVPVQNLIRNVYGLLSNTPVMELHSMNKKTVENLLKQEKIEIINIDEYGDLGPAWQCFRYCVRKL